MTNQLAIPQSSNFKGEMKAAYDAIYPLYGILFGSDQFEIPISLSGSLTVANDITVGSSLNVVDWKIDVTGDDLRFRDDGLVERFRLGDNSSAFAAKVFGPLYGTGNLTIDGNTTLGNAATDTTLVSGPLTIQDWDAVLDGDDLVFQDDANAEIIRFGDTSSTWHLKVTGPAWATGNIQTGGNLLINSSGYLSIGSSAVSTAGSAIRTAKSASWYARNAADSGNIQVVLCDGSDNIVFGGTSGVNNASLAGSNAYMFAGSTERIRVNGTGIGFFASSPNAKQTVTGSRGGNAALQSLLSALANYGLITDSSS